MASSNLSLAAKSCACAYITFLAGIFSWYADSTFVETGRLEIYDLFLQGLIWPNYTDLDVQNTNYVS
jgi:hypothetical protein